MALVVPVDTTCHRESGSALRMLKFPELWQRKGDQVRRFFQDRSNLRVRRTAQEKNSSIGPWSDGPVLEFQPGQTFWRLVK